MGLKKLTPPPRFLPDDEGFLGKKNHYHVWLKGEVGGLGHISETDYKQWKQLQLDKPVSIGTVRGGKQRSKTLWWYKDEFYVENEGYSSEEVQLLVWEKEQRQKRKFGRLRKEMLSEHGLHQARRERIPEDVRIFVWKRDGGRCVKCGSQENLEFDHIIPVSKGGSNTARNIQLLCEACNRTKSDRL